MENWKTIPFAPDYKVSDLGRVMRSTNGTGLSRAKAGRIIKPATAGHNRRYLHVGISSGGKIKYFNIHVLVAATFLGDFRGKGLVVAHTDNDGHNNALSNLRWCTQADNLRDRIAHMTHDRGERNTQARLTEDDVRKIRAAEGSEKEIAPHFGVSPSTIGRIKRRQRWAHVA